MNRCSIAVAVVAVFLMDNALARSPAPPPIPGIELIKQGDCATFARTTTSRDAYSVNGWLEALVSLNPKQWLTCLDALPRPLQAQLLLTSAARDNRLLKAWREHGGDLNSIRTKDVNLMCVAASRGNIALMEWLQSSNLRPLEATDEANELADAAAQLGVHPKPSIAAFDWLLSHGYAWPEHPATAHRLLASVADSANDTLLLSAAKHFQERSVMQGVLTYDKDESFRPLIFHARTPRAVQFMDEWHVNVHARQIDRQTAEVTFPSALFNHQLTAGTLKALLDLGVSPKGRDALGYTPLVFAIRYRPTDLELIERYLKAGAEVRDPRVDPIVEAAGLQTDKVSPDRLRELIRLLIRYGANPRPEHRTDCCGGLHEAGLPIHTTIANGQTAFISVWMDELHLAPDVRHPGTNASLLAYALEQENLSEETVVELVSELARLGLSMPSSGESPVARAIAGRKQPPTALVRKLLALGVDINAVDDKIGMTALALVIHQMHEIRICDADSCWMTESQTIELVRQLVQQGARPEVAGPSGESALSMAQQFDDHEILEVFRAVQARASN